jgi:hypothetical protein
MRECKKLAYFTVICLIFSVPLYGAAAEIKHKPHYRHYVSKSHHHRLWLANQTDNNGWRHRSRGWDNTCLNLAYLPSEFACDAK